MRPKENREVPPLRYELAYRLKRDFPHLTIGINGGITTNAQIAEHLQQVDGVMVGREAYHNPWLLTSWDETFFGAAPSTITREAVEEQMVPQGAPPAARQSRFHGGRLRDRVLPPSGLPL